MSSSKSQMPIVVLEAIGLLVSTVVQTPPRRTPEAPGAAGPTPADQFHPNANAPILPGRTCLERVGLNRYSGWQPTDCQQKGGDGARRQAHGPRRKGGGDREGGHPKQTYVPHPGCPTGCRIVLPNCAAELAAEQCCRIWSPCRRIVLPNLSVLLPNCAAEFRASWCRI